MNKFCFGAIYNGRLWEKELCVSALNMSYIGFESQFFHLCLGPLGLN